MCDLCVQISIWHYKQSETKKTKFQMGHVFTNAEHTNYLDHWFSLAFDFIHINTTIVYYYCVSHSNCLLNVVGHQLTNYTSMSTIFHWFYLDCFVFRKTMIILFLWLLQWLQVFDCQKRNYHFFSLVLFWIEANIKTIERKEKTRARSGKRETTKIVEHFVISQQFAYCACIYYSRTCL